MMHGETLPEQYVMTDMISPIILTISHIGDTATGAVTGILIACNLPAKHTTLGRAVTGMLASLAHSIRAGKFKTIKGAVGAIGAAIASGIATSLVSCVKAKYGRTLNYNTAKQLVGKISINRFVRGTIRASFKIGWIKFSVIIN